jgi:cell division septation protein DedD
MPDGSLSTDLSFIGGIGIPQTARCEADVLYGCTDGGYGGWSSFQDRIRRYCPGEVRQFEGTNISMCYPGQYGGVADMPFGRKWDIPATFARTGVSMQHSDPQRVATCQPWSQADNCAQVTRGAQGCLAEDVCEGAALFYEGYDMRELNSEDKWHFNGYSAFVHTICGVYGGFGFSADDRGVGTRHGTRMKYASNVGTGCRNPTIELCPAASPSYTETGGYTYPPNCPPAQGPTPTPAPVAPSPAPVPTPAPVAPTPTPAQDVTGSNLYEHSANVGGWGGWCTCPDGQRYNVGDQRDGCANGPASLACFGGSPGECIREVDPNRQNMQVTCAAPAEASYQSMSVVQNEGSSVGDFATGSFTLEQCMEACDAEPRCNSFAYANNGNCHLKDRCVNALDPTSSNPGNWRTYYKPCKGAAPSPPAPAPRPSPSHSSGPALPPAPSPAANVYERADNVGGWGGFCTCPDGQRYNVGDQMDGCARGPASLACFGGGAPGECIREVDPSRQNMQVTCAASPANEAQAPAPAPAGPIANVYEAAAGVGGWGGWCTCPDGHRYNVGDLNDGCAKGPASLACVGGTPGACNQVVDPDRQGMRVTCASNPRP